MILLVTTTINLLLLAAVFLAAVVMIDRMSGSTRGAVRWGAALLLAGAVAEVVGYTWRLANWAHALFLNDAGMCLVGAVAEVVGHGWHLDNWADALFFGGAGMCLVANLRFPAGARAAYPEWTLAQRAESERRSNRYAYTVGALTVLGVIFSWATS